MSLYNKIIDLQKLQNAWKQVYKNKPKEGVDMVTCEEFEADKKNRIKALWNELLNHTYESFPVQTIPIYKGEKVRYISLYTMRDKVVQYSVARELSLIFEPLFSDSCYAYRSGKSALHAAQVIHERILDKKYEYVLRADICSFFDCILHDVMLKKLREQIREEDVLELIQRIMKAASLEKTGELKEKCRGIYQGATIAPVLSNIYLAQMDKRIREETLFYIRYSDDILLFFYKRPEAEAYRKQLALYLGELGLTLNEEKTKVVQLTEGFEFLGYSFDENGRSIPKKAKNQLTERLEEVWLGGKYPSLKLRLEKGFEILNGWEQYFTGERTLDSILEYAVWVYHMQNTGTLDLEKMKLYGEKLENPYKDIAGYLAGIWKENERYLQELEEYERYFSLHMLDEEVRIKPENPILSELLGLYRRYMVQETEEIETELIQLYSDLKMYRKAAALLETSQRNRRQTATVRLTPWQTEDDEKINLTAKERSRYMDLFAGREDLYALDGITDGNRRRNEEILHPLTTDVVSMHLEQKETVSTYVQRSNGTVKYLVLDLDISKGVLLQCRDEAVKQEYMKKCLGIAAGILKELRHMGLNGYLEQSGCRGYHIWIFFEEWISVRYVNLLSDIIMQKSASLWTDQDSSGIQIEYFPNKTRVRNGKKGQCLKLPWGRHPKTGKTSRFLNSDFEYYEPQKALLEDVVQYPLNTIKRIISANKSEESCGSSRKLIEVDRELQEFGVLCETVQTVLNSCNLLRYLCQKARTTHYLSHFERLSVLYVFGHLGEEGREFIHRVMAFTLNYSYQVTEKFIRRCPEKPISCLKLQEQYRQISAEIGCSCNFKRTKNCYPSPVLHALKNAEENSQVTMPVSKSLSAGKQSALKEEINAGARAESVAGRMVELRKQRRNLDKALRKCEQELMDIFDDSGTDSMEIKMGLLVRRKNGEKIEWMIEL